jgi:hypothetical protein
MTRPFASTLEEISPVSGSKVIVVVNAVEGPHPSGSGLVVVRYCCNPPADS